MKNGSLVKARIASSSYINVLQIEPVFCFIGKSKSLINESKKVYTTARTPCSAPIPTAPYILRSVEEVLISSNRACPLVKQVSRKRELARVSGEIANHTR
mgnify:CR=1